MTLLEVPEVTPNDVVANIIGQACESSGSLRDLEAEFGETGEISAPFRSNDAWKSFVEKVLCAWQAHDHVVVRGLPVLGEGASLLVASLALAGRFKTYRGGSIVKTFRMSPWTRDLSHTLREGEFHTDLNTDPDPPAVTCIQCSTPDPGAPRYGVNRVASAATLLTYLESAGKNDLLQFLRETQASMVNDHSDSVWAGTIVEGERIRFHPETLRAAARRLQADESDLEFLLSGIHEAALAVSSPFWLETGDILFLSNHRTLHYRGECSVVFAHFPLDFQSRSIHLLHKRDDPQ